MEPQLPVAKHSVFKNNITTVMKKFFLWFLPLLPGISAANVTVTPAANGTCLQVSPGAFSNIGTITVAESAMTDFASPQTNVTLILTAPVNFEFNPGVGTVSYTAGRNITFASVAVTSTTVTVTLSVSGTNRLDNLYISNLQMRGLTTMASGQLLRTLAGGTAVIAGNDPGAGVNHGTLTSDAGGVTFTSIANGNWSSAATWSGGVVPPSCASDIVINHTVTADVSGYANNLTINSTGNLIASNPVTVTGTFLMNSGSTYTHANLSAASTTIFAGTENFNAASNIIVNNWFNSNSPLATGVSSDFGNITINASLANWNQNGLFSPARIKGTFTVSSGSVNMDNGTGMTTSLTLNDVIINGTGSIVFQRGANRNLTLVTGNFTDNSVSTTATTIMFRSHGVLNWTVNGNLNLSHDFNAQIGTTGAETGSSIIQVNGDLNVSGGRIGFNRVMDGPVSLTVTGNTNISGNPNYFRLNETGSGSVSFSTTNLNVTGGARNEINGGANPTGSVVVNINGNFYMNGIGSVFYFINSPSSTGTLQLNVTNDLTVVRGSFRMVNSSGLANISVGRDILISSTSSIVYGQYNTTSSADVNLSAGRNFTISSGLFYQTAGLGSISLNVAQSMAMNNGTFYGTNNTTSGNYGTAVCTIGSFNYNGGSFYFHNSNVTDGRNVVINCLGDFDIRFTSSVNRVVLINQAGINNAGLMLTIGGNFMTSGSNTTAYFLSSASSGNEFIGISGSMTLAASDVFIAGTTTPYGNNHDVTLSIMNNLTVTAGNLYCSTVGGNAAVSVNGNVSITGGTVNAKWNTGKTDFIISGNYTQSGGTFNFHARNAVTADSVQVTLMGNFNQTGGTISFDAYQGEENPENYLYIYGTTFSVGGTGIISHANHLTTYTKFGNIWFNRTGTTTYNRSSTNHDIRQVKIFVSGECVLDAEFSTQPLQIASHASSDRNTHTTFEMDGILSLGTRQILARQQANYYACIQLNQDSRLRTAHTGGLYSGTATASCINSMISGLNRMDYYLDPLSIVEYCGTANQTVTGIPNGIAATNNHKYGILEINHQGTLDASWVSPEAANEVYVRTTLQLERGELNLDTDHNPSNGGGRPVIIEDYANVSRNTGYIRSETEDGSGLLRWNIPFAGGTHIIPFGYNSSNYIPFTFSPTSGITGTLSVATYHTLPSNVVYPAGVLHVNDLTGADNSANTVDRFWRVDVSGTAVADITFEATSAESGTITNPRAQRWTPANNGWEPAQGVQSNPTSTSTLASGISGLGTWWTLSSSTSPLPVQLAYIKTVCIDRKVSLQWVTQSELNNDYFFIEKSTDGRIFNELAKVKGAGTTSATSYYSFVDDETVKGKSAIYRLSQTDFNGQPSRVGEVQSAACNSKPVLSIQQVISSSSLSLHINSETSGNATIEIADATGKKVKWEKMELQAGINSVIITDEFAAGFYTATVRCNNEIAVAKTVIQ